MKQATESNPLKRRIKHKTVFLFALISLIIFGIFFISYTWRTSLQVFEDQAVLIAETGAAGFQMIPLNQLEVKPDDINKTEYQQIKESLKKLIALNPSIRFAYIYTMKNGHIYFMADSEPENSSDYSPPGQEYTEAAEPFFRVFTEGKTIITEPTTDRWGNWTSVLVPIKDPETGQVIATFGMDYPSEDWYNQAIDHSLLAFSLMLSLFLVLFSFYLVFLKNIDLKEEQNKLLIASKKQQESEMLFRTIFDQAPVGIAVVNANRSIDMVNATFFNIIGRKKEDPNTLNWMAITHPDDLKKDLAYYEKFCNGAIDGYSMEKRYLKPDGTVVTADMIIAPLKTDQKSNYHHLCIINDISEHKKIENALIESERSKAVFISNLPGIAYRCHYDTDWTMTFVSDGCYKLTGYQPDAFVDNKKLAFNDIILPKHQKNVWDQWTHSIDTHEHYIGEYEIITATGEIKWVYEQGRCFYDENGQAQALEGLIIDITDRKNKEKEIIYANEHDYLTGLYNRRYFENRLREIDTDEHLPLSYIIGDINGVRLINDAFGLLSGDELIIRTGMIMKSCCREKDILARIGGDEFCILLPNTDSATAEEIVLQISHACEVYNCNPNPDIPYISLSMGNGTKEIESTRFSDIIKEAEADMYKQKLLERKSAHSSIIASIKATMFEKSKETEEHGQRMVQFSKALGLALRLSPRELNKLELFAMLHDLGKIGIDERILSKPGKLTDDEWIIMKKHPEIGYRIAMSAPELVPISELILSHHERWDGKGYPRGLQGTEILLGARIVAIVDAYDAMTSDRSYRKAMTKQAAIEELHQNSHTQFDPQIIEIFVNTVLPMFI